MKARQPFSLIVLLTVAAVLFVLPACSGGDDGLVGEEPGRATLAESDTPEGTTAVPPEVSAQMEDLKKKTDELLKKIDELSQASTSEATSRAAALQEEVKKLQEKIAAIQKEIDAANGKGPGDELAEGFDFQLIPRKGTSVESAVKVSPGMDIEVKSLALKDVRCQDVLVLIGGWSLTTECNDGLRFGFDLGESGSYFVSLYAKGMKSREKLVIVADEDELIPGFAFSLEIPTAKPLELVSVNNSSYALNALTECAVDVFMGGVEVEEVHDPSEKCGDGLSFLIPKDTAPGTYTVYAVANGIESKDAEIVITE